ncbi:hypothetical protein [Pararobbsia silviterrae]|uniref:Uncharacterized protein n=1 Tax=Pararobbsia silviterrae TaxID=1792498 RepID=A0A494Y5W9_9BURK|nr:hypothetical protein [Pararobbsia silviterrae]RKP57492.1 hypothetical protein D7S86_05855 [Pararobbsia silviterrae]
MAAQFVLWLFLNIGVPIFAPLFSLLSMSPVIGSRASHQMMCASIRDGQLFWVAIGLCAAGTFEVLTAECAPAGPGVLCAVFLVCYGIVGFGSIVALSAATVVGHFRRAMKRLMTPTRSPPMSLDQYRGLMALASIRSRGMFIRWSIRSATFSAVACVGFHSMQMVWSMFF